MDIGTKHIKEIYEHESIVEYYDLVVDKIGILNSERIIIQKYIDRRCRILDIGCGAGRTTIGLKKLGYKSVGIDISERMIEKAKQRDALIDFTVADVLRLPFNNESFDAAFFSFNGLMLIPNIENRKKAIIEVKRILKPGGYFIFSTPYLDNKADNPFWKERLQCSNSYDSLINLGDLFIDDMGVENIYIHIPFIKEIENMLGECGYSIIEYKPRTQIYMENDDVENELDDNLYWIVRSD